MDHPTSILQNHDFVVDCARYAEGLLSEKEVKKKHHFDDATWEPSARTTRWSKKSSLRK